MVELRLRKTRQVGASREVLPQEQSGVFVGAALPGTLWIAEVDLHIRGYRKVFVFGHLQSAVPGQRAFQRSGEFTKADSKPQLGRCGSSGPMHVQVTENR